VSSIGEIEPPFGVYLGQHGLFDTRGLPFRLMTSRNRKMEMRLTPSKRIRRFIFSLLLESIFLTSSRARVTRLSAEFVFRMREEHPEAPFFHSREKLWKSFSAELRNQKWVGFEFGVASGDATKNFLKMPYAENCLQWNGFDTFYGLPSAWGDLPKGAFSTNGNVPKINSKIINWLVGPIEDTCKDIKLLNYLEQRFIIIFDFDLYSATKCAWIQISEHLKAGDIVYFDEAYEWDEKQIIDEIYKSRDFSFEVLGFTTMGVAFLVK